MNVRGGRTAFLLGALAIACAGIPVAPELGRKAPPVSEAPLADPYEPLGFYRRREYGLDWRLGDTWATPAPRPIVDTDQDATIEAARAKRDRKRAARLARGCP